ncbi:acetyl esterase [Terrimicrobium sacchariphilum]|uniref:Acetyl esterase n=1 Tax=Terrimicrobium sacchariphilum TaxID=690879 RepID=A0A146G8H5_TERSA|nr:alpha/beta hydrolase [Terrimicrobium sacchariphilum]GAT33603.1 acetyl esterase [Terrimicrobium sacchariphilum]
MTPGILSFSRASRTLVAAAVVLGFLTAALPAGEDISFKSDIPYLGADRTEKLDVYLPAVGLPRPRPAVIFIHGGGWSGGSKSDQLSKEFCNALAEKGYVAVSIDYLLNKARKDIDGKTHFDKVAWPQNFLDCKTAVRFVRKNARDFGIDPDRLAIMGASAGAHLALLVAATKDSDQWNKGGLYLDQSNDISAVIEFYGRHDVTVDRRPHFAGATEEETESNVIAASPATHLTSKMPPVLAVQGDADDIVPVSFGRRLITQLKELGVPYEYIEVPGAKHAFGLTPPQKDLRAEVFAFLAKYLGQNLPAENQLD